ncbi:MAG: 2-C-methyl-D-erythritol 4-phosphate cytidylyltransferase [Actinobacteria bacterium]|nr:2-C-methyl-D-erythritol 4-phosphate cytidylyltransferase [Actinomycetota bacterium]
MFAISSEQLDALAANLTELKGEVSAKPQTAAVILAGGSGERFGYSAGKQLFEVLGRPVVTWSAEAFDAVPDVGLIVIVCPEDQIREFCEKALDPYPFVTPIVMVPAGTIRQESAYNGINAVDEKYEFIAIHDGARPLITPSLIIHATNMIKGNLDADGAVVGHPAIDTLKVVGNDGTVVGTPDRSMFWVAQTPQIFRADIIRKAHSAAMSDGFVGTDDSSLVERLGGKIFLVNGPRDNIKLTVPEDRGPIEAALKVRLRHRDCL